MDNSEKLESLRELFTDVSKQLTVEFAKQLPDDIVLVKFRKQLSQLDKDIRRIQNMKDMGN